MTADVLYLPFLSQPVPVGPCGNREETQGSQSGERATAQREGESAAVGNAGWHP